MAVSTSSLPNFLSFLLPTKQPSPPPSPPQLNLPSSSPLPSHTLKMMKPSHNSASPTTPRRDGPSCDELSSVVCPSLAYSNTLFFRSAYNVQVVVGEEEGEERLLNRFRREVMKAGVIQECKRRRFFENKQDEKKRKHRDAAKRASRARYQIFFFLFFFLFLLIKLVSK